jgi:hypothetical protein
VGLVLLILSPAIILFMPEEWTSRMSTIKTYDEDSSAMGRLNAWTMAINIANNRLMGAGFTNDSPLIYQMYAPDPNFVIVAHSIYFQVLGSMDISAWAISAVLDTDVSHRRGLEKDPSVRIGNGGNWRE